MIDFTKRNACDNCDVASSKKHPVEIYTMELERSHKKICLCKNCLQDLFEATKRTLEEK